MSRPQTVDVHAHVDVPAIEELVDGQPGLAAERAAQLATFGAESTARNIELANTSYQPFLTTPAARLSRMDAGGIDVQAVSVVPTLYHYWADEALAADLVAAANGHILDLVALEPRRLVGLATVSLQHPALAVDQLRQAFTAGMRGVQISTSVAGRELSDRSLDPFWAAAEELGAFVFIHPWGCSLGSRLATSYLGNIVGNPTETTLALTHLVFGAVFDRFPRLRVCGAHGGGYFPHYLGRADHAYQVRPESRTMSRPPSEYLDSIWVDSLVYEADILTALVKVLGAEHVVLGSDYPFDMGVLDPLERLDAAGLSPADRDAIAGGAATRLLNLATEG
ncbi:amidohydrolase family protein [uncultured Jatrophihabitans sp.]|uniref:amidohydrolase family protein n=1 Tax=uncultured Jatrophihabitans sp. TaxID=1610747 RepID=UPI0035CC8B0D